MQKNYSYHRYNQLSNPRYGQRPGVRLALPQSKRQIPRKTILVAVGIILVLVVAKNVFASNNSPDQPSVAGASTQQMEEKAPPPPKKVVDATGLQEGLAQTIKKYPYDTSVSVVDLNSGQLYQSGDTYPFMAASTTKILTALYYFNKVENKQASLNDPIGSLPAKDQLQAMINKSDNTAWKLFNDQLGRDSLAVYAKAQGLTSYDSTKNTVTSNDMALLLAKLYKQELINKEHTALLLSWMKNTSEERFIPPAIPAGNAAYHKAGYLNDRVHDVAIVDNGSTPFVIVIYSKSYGNALYNYETGQRLFKEATNQVVTVFNR